MPIANFWGSLFTWLLHVPTSLIYWVSLASFCVQPGDPLASCSLCSHISQACSYTWSSLPTTWSSWLCERSKINTIIFSDCSYASDRGDQQSISGYCTFLGGNLVTWQSKKQHVVSLSSVEAEYCVMMHDSFEMLWVYSFIQELGFLVYSEMPMYCDNWAIIFLGNNPTFHERTK